jgi:hypothetical protein
MFSACVPQAIVAVAMAMSSATAEPTKSSSPEKPKRWALKVNQDPVTPPSPQAEPAKANPNFFNPQISLVTDFRAILGGNIPNDDKTADLKEAELGFAADVDPFLRAEAYIAVAKEEGESKIEVEEAFGRYSNLGRGLSAKFGKIAAAIGRVQRNHADQLSWLDYPLVVQDFLGEEGFRAGGASVSYLLPGDKYHEFTLEGLDGRETPLFKGSKSTTPTWVGHYRTFFDFGENASLLLGASYANGPSASSDKKANMYGADLTYKWHPGTTGKSAQFEAEAYWADPGIPGADTAFGAFAALTYEIRPRLHLTAKYDYSEIPGTPDIHSGVSFGATLKVTEFHHWRAEWKTIGSNFDKTRNVFTVQFQWAIGAHPAHKY